MPHENVAAPEVAAAHAAGASASGRFDVFGLSGGVAPKK